MNYETLLFEIPLYNKLKFDQENANKLVELFMSSGKIEGYSPFLKENTTYTVKSTPPRSTIGAEVLFWEGITVIKATCTRTGKAITAWVLVEQIKGLPRTDSFTHTLQKIGEYPSIADLHISKIKNYDKVLPNEKLKELTRAIGIASAGVGIGSYVYLRRVFEYLIVEAYEVAKAGQGWDDLQYVNARMIDKIELLKDHLPPFLVENRFMYGILSKGIHELTEKECLDYFEPLKIAITLILDEKVVILNRQRTIEEAKKRLAEISSKLGGR